MSATPSERASVSIDDDIDFVTEQIEALKELGHRDEVGDVYADEDVYDLSVRWGTALAGRLPRMAHYSSCGLLNDADERRFQVLCEELHKVTPLIERFKLAHPHREERPTKRKRLLRR